MYSARSICRAYLGCFLLRSTRCAAFKDLEGGEGEGAMAEEVDA